MRILKVGETDSNKLKTYFNLFELDNQTPALNEAGGQPQISINDGAFTSSNITTLTHTGYGRYWAQLSSSIVTTDGDIIRTRYKSNATLESRGDTFQVINLSENYTSGNLSNTSYVTVHEADQYFSNRLNTKYWDLSSYNDKFKALCSATEVIDRLNFSGEKSNSGQVLQFPRKNVFVLSESETKTTQDVNIPADIKIATYLIALKFLEGFDPDLEAESLSKTGNQFHQAKVNYDRNFIQDYQRAGIPSHKAWMLLKPYLRDPRNFDLVRVS